MLARNFEINKIRSNKVKLFQGVPQGSILEPLLLIIYVNELPLNTNRVLVTQFADDTTLSVSDFSNCVILNTIYTTALDVIFN